MEKPAIFDRLLQNLNNIHEIGRQQALELGNPYYAQFKGDAPYWRKEMPSGDKFLVALEVLLDDHDVPTGFREEIVRQIA